MIYLLFSLVTGYACSCDFPNPPNVEYENMDVVFSGTIIKVEVDSSFVYLENKVTIDVIDSWKGNLSGKVTVWTSITGASCGFLFQNSSSYLIYGYSVNDSIHTNICTRTKILKMAGEDLEYLNSLSNLDNSKNEYPNSAILYQNYPNPFNASTNIKFYLSKKSKVELTVFNLQGKLVKLLLRDYLNESTYSIKFLAEDLPSGVYYYRLVSAEKMIIKKMILLQ